MKNQNTSQNAANNNGATNPKKAQSNSDDSEFDEKNFQVINDPEMNQKQEQYQLNPMLKNF